jgi:hypothetical protein
MSNHLHLVVQQGKYPLSRLMHSVLRRIAHAVHRHLDRKGPVFWGRYSCTPCLDPGHARNAVVYTHLNPVRAGLCREPAHYPWSSHRSYTARATPLSPAARRRNSALRGAVDMTALGLFASAPGRSFGELRDDYDGYVSWRMDRDRWAASLETDGLAPPPPEPPLVGGGVDWVPALSPYFHTEPTLTNGRGVLAGAPDLMDIARMVLGASAPGLPFTMIRGRGGGRHFSRIRRQIIERGHAAGYPNVDLAHLLDVSESTVSMVLCAGRSR